MSERAASPLPWTFDSYDDEGTVYDADGCVVASVTHAYPEGPIKMDAADARLIVEAVNGYARLREALAGLVDRFDDGWLVDEGPSRAGGWQSDALKAALANARAALAPLVGPTEKDGAS